MHTSTRSQTLVVPTAAIIHVFDEADALRTLQSMVANGELHGERDTLEQLARDAVAGRVMLLRPTPRAMDSALEAASTIPTLSQLSL